MGIAPTDRPVEVHGCTVNEIKNGKAVHVWMYGDSGHLLRQLGVLPSPAESEPQPWLRDEGATRGGEPRQRKPIRMWQPGGSRQ
jgi:hypothetical protein